MNTNKITITIVDDKVAVNIDKKLTLPEILQILGTASLQAMNTTYQASEQHAEPERLKLQAHIYDMYNYLASNILTSFAPEFDKNPDLTTQAILEKENEIIERKYNAIQKSNSKSKPTKPTKPTKPKNN